MLYSLRGKLTYSEFNITVIECSGVGYKCVVSSGTQRKLAQNGEEVFLYTYMSVKEGSVELFGFADKEELSCFKMLIEVSGVGAKVAIAILSTLSVEQIAASIVSSDIKSITMAPGVGKKLAQRIILELKDKISKIPMDLETTDSAVGGNVLPRVSSNISKAVEALKVLGYSSSQILPVINNFDMNLPVEELIRLTLREIGGNK